MAAPYTDRLRSEIPASAGAQIDEVALRLLVSEARRLDGDRAAAARRRGARAASPAALDRRWRGVGGAAVRSLRRGAAPEQARAEFAGRFPFLGLVAAEEIEACAARRQRVIDRLRERGTLFLPPTEALLAPSPAAEAAEEGEAEAEDDGADDAIDMAAALTAITAAVTAASAVPSAHGLPPPTADELCADRWRRWRGDLEGLVAPPQQGTIAPSFPDLFTADPRLHPAAPPPPAEPVWLPLGEDLRFTGTAEKSHGMFPALWSEQPEDTQGAGEVTTSRLFTRWAAEAA